MDYFKIACDIARKDAERILLDAAIAREPRCGVKYAHGLCERWCDRITGHTGPHSGNLTEVGVKA
jgi:hypothetical protein